MARAARARLRGVRGAGAIALREFSRRVAAAAAGDAAARRRRVRVRARGRRHGRRRNRARRRAPGAARRVATAAACGGLAGRAASAAERGRPRRPDRRRARALDSIARSAAGALRRSGERVRSGYHDDAVCFVGRRARLLPPLRESDRPPRAPHRRLPGCVARSIVRRAVHRAAADELLAGLRPRLARRTPVRAARRAGACGADETNLRDAGGRCR